MYFENVSETLYFKIEEYHAGTPEYEILVDFIYSIGGIL